LVGKGHRKLLFLNGQSDWPAFVIRSDAAMHCAENNGIKLSVVSIETYRPDTQVLDDVITIRDEIMLAIRRVSGECTGIFCANDVLGVLAVQACHRLGLDVPGEISIVGYSVSSLSQVCDPALTAVQQPHYEMGHTAAFELVDVLRKGAGRIFERAVEIKLPTSIMEGGTVASV